MACSRTTWIVTMPSNPVSLPERYQVHQKSGQCRSSERKRSQNRGLYAGAVGYIGFDRNLEFAIAIRTVIVRNGRAYVQVGAGIVADSVPANEWKETESKASAMLRAIERAGVSS